MKPAAIFKIGRKICGYVMQNGNDWMFCTGKPSDQSAIAWSYKLDVNAYLQGHEYMRGYSKPFGGRYTMTADGKVYRYPDEYGQEA